MAVNSEREILDRVRGSMRGKGTGLALGIGDDCAIYRPRPGEELLFTTDLLIEDVHFRRATHSARDIGYKALARGLSDLAAMGASPRFCLFSLAVPAWADARFVGGVYRGLLDLSESTGCPLAGGDLARAEATDFADADTSKVTLGTKVTIKPEPAAPSTPAATGAAAASEARSGEVKKAG